LAKDTNNNYTADISMPLVIVNPESASGSTSGHWTSTASDLRTHFGPFRAAFTKAPGDATDIAEREAKNGRRFIIACGGDGTINEVANGIIRSGVDAELGVLPSGTGGDFRRTLGLPSTNREAAIALRDGETKTMDVGHVTFQDHDGKTVSRYFLNISSIGLAAAVIRRVKTVTMFDWLPVNSIRGKASFAVSALKEMLEIEPVAVRIRIDDGPEKTIQTINFCVANSRYFGGGMKIAPDAKINDGLLDVVNVGDMSTMNLLLNAYSVYRGTHLKIDEVKSTLAKRVEISAVDPSQEIILETDGEMPGKLPAKYKVVPGALRVRVPKSNP
jgi:diacylglycerol kinase (ATP)